MSLIPQARLIAHFPRFPWHSVLQLLLNHTYYPHISALASLFTHLSPYSNCVLVRDKGEHIDPCSLLIVLQYKGLEFHSIV